MKKCKNCHEKEAIKYSKYSNGEFCSKECARAYSTKNKRKEINKKISESLSGRVLSDEHKQKLMGNKNGNHRTKWSEERKKETSERVKNFWLENPDKVKSVSDKLKGRGVSNETRKKLSLSALERVKNGTHSGWKSRNKPSYPELFFMKVLGNNNINYEFEKPCGKYFIDFAIEDKMIALEIDGKQHLLPERIEKDKEKDKYLNENGWVVYRIPWKSINRKSGKEYIKNEINKFILFYKNKE